MVLKNSWLLSLLLPLMASASQLSQVPKPKPLPNLIQESEGLSVLKEASVQRDPDPSRRLYGFHILQITARKLSIESNERLIEYNPVGSALGARLGYLPIQFAGFIGLVGSVNYAYMERGDFDRTALHWLFADVALVYRYERASTDWFKPYLGVGGGSHVLIQRGTTPYDTSVARGVGFAMLGVAWNVSRAFKLNSPLAWEMTAHFKRSQDPGNEYLNFTGDQISLGLELAL